MLSNGTWGRLCRETDWVLTDWVFQTFQVHPLEHDEPYKEGLDIPGHQLEHNEDYKEWLDITGHQLEHDEPYREWLDIPGHQLEHNEDHKVWLDIPGHQLEHNEDYKECLDIPYHQLEHDNDQKEWPPTRTWARSSGSYTASRARLHGVFEHSTGTPLE